jgi:hypothetical protein
VTVVPAGGVLVDTNLLLYALLRRTEQHTAARQWLTDQFSTPEAWSASRGRRSSASPGSSRPGAWSVTTPPASEAWGAVVTLLRQPTARLIEPAPTHAATAGRLLAPPGLSFNDVPDVHLAALALDHGLVLCSHDQGFARVDGLRWTDPLTA